MDDYSLLPIDEKANSEMLGVQGASPINAGGLRILFDRSPDLFALPKLKYTENLHLGFYNNGRLKGYGSLGLYDAYVAHQKQTVFSIYNFYLLPEARGRQLPGRAVKEMLEVADDHGANFGIALTMKGNRSAESYIGRRMNEGVPLTRVMDEQVVKTIFFSKRMRNTTPYRVRTAVAEDIPSIVTLLQAEHEQRDFGLVYTESQFIHAMEERRLSLNDYYVALDRKGAISGVCLAWDCNRFRRTSVLRYSAGFYPVLSAYRLLANFFSMAPFPAQGESFRELTITDWAVAGRDPEVMHALLSEVYHRNHNKKYHYMNWGSCGSDPLLKAASGFWHKDITSHMLFTSRDPKHFNLKTRLPYIDIAFL